MWNLRLIGALAALSVCVGSVWYAYSSGKQSGMSVIQSQWDAERAATLAAQAEEVMKAAQKEAALKALIDKQRKDHQREAIRLANDYAAVVDSLQDRPEARAGAGGVPEGADAGAEPAGWCDGSRLYRDHATAFAGEAALAAQLQAALRACIAHSTAVERQLNGPVVRGVDNGAR